jgi:putative transposase
VLWAYLFYGIGYPVVALFHSFPTYYGPEFTAQAVRTWLEVLKVRTLFIEPGSPWENGYVQSFIGKLRDELLNGEIFDTLLEARVVMGDWKKEYNQIRPHSSLGYRPPAPVTYSVEKFNLGVVH